MFNYSVNEDLSLWIMTSEHVSNPVCSYCLISVVIQKSVIAPCSQIPVLLLSNQHILLIAELSPYGANLTLSLPVVHYCPYDKVLIVPLIARISPPKTPLPCLPMSCVVCFVCRRCNSEKIHSMLFGKSTTWGLRDHSSLCLWFYYYFYPPPAGTHTGTHGHT